MQISRKWFFFLLIAIQEILYLFIGTFKNWSSHIPLFLILFYFLFACYFACVILTKETMWTPKQWFGILMASALFRLTLVGSAPFLSDDLYRFLWEGKLWAHGWNPYRYAPDHPALITLRESWWPQINHPQLASLYPPAAQLFFFLSYLLWPSCIVGFKLLVAGVDLATIVILQKIVQRLGLKTGRLLIYAFNPLVIIELAGTGHVDGLAILGSVLALYFALNEKLIRSTVALAASAATKLYAALLLPFLVRRARQVSLFIAITLPWVLWLVIANPPFRLSSFSYVRDWTFNASLYRLLELLFHSAWCAKGASMALLIGLLASLIYKKVRPERACFWILATVLLLSPTVHPWYVTWILPFLVFELSWAWIVFTGLCALSYTVLIDYAAKAAWQENTLVTWIEYIVFYGLWCVELWKKGAQREKASWSLKVRCRR